MAEQPEVEELAIEKYPSENGNIIIATINRPEKLNALNVNVKEAIKRPSCFLIRFRIVEWRNPMQLLSTNHSAKS